MIPKSLHVVNEGVAFLLEIAAIVALCWWGFRTGRVLAPRILLGLGAPAVLIVIWGTFCAPRARIKLDLIPLMIVRALVLLSAAVAMFATGWHVAALVFAAVVVVNGVIAALDSRALVNTRELA